MTASGFSHRPAPEAGAEGAPVAAPLALLVVCGLLVLMQVYVAIPLAPEVGRALGGRGAAAALGTAYSIAYAFGILVLGTLSDRYGRKAIIVPGMAALAVATAALAAASSLPVVRCCAALRGLWRRASRRRRSHGSPRPCRQSGGHQGSAP
jgi:MFS family permease